MFLEQFKQFLLSKKKVENSQLTLKEIAVNNSNDYNYDRLSAADMDSDYEFSMIYQSLYNKYGMDNELIAAYLESYKYAYKHYNKDAVLYNMECLSYLLNQIGLKVVASEDENAYSSRLKTIYLSDTDDDTLWHELGHAIHDEILNTAMPSDLDKKLKSIRNKNKETIKKVADDLTEGYDFYCFNDENKKYSISGMRLISDFISGVFVYLYDNNSYYLRQPFYHGADYYADYDCDFIINDNELIFSELMANFNRYLVSSGKELPKFVKDILGDELCDDIASLFLEKADPKLKFDCNGTSRKDFLDSEQLQQICNTDKDEKEKVINEMADDFYRELILKYGKDAPFLLQEYLEGDYEALLEVPDLIDKIICFPREQVITLFNLAYCPSSYYETLEHDCSFFAQKNLPISSAVREIDEYEEFDYLLRKFVTDEAANKELKACDNLMILDYLIEQYPDEESVTLLEDAMRLKTQELTGEEKHRLHMADVDYAKKFSFAVVQQHENLTRYRDYYGINYLVNSSIDINSDFIKNLVECVHNKVDEVGFDNNPIRTVFVSKNSTMIPELYETSKYDNAVVVNNSLADTDVSEIVSRKFAPEKIKEKK